MKNITFFVPFVSIVCCLLYAAPAFGDESPYTVSVTPQFGFLWGQGEEQVYRDSGTDDLISQLLWDSKPLWYAGTSLEFIQRDPLSKPGFFGVFTMKFGIPAETGAMEDRDWQTPKGELSNYSHHDANTDSAMILDLAAGFSIPIRRLVTARLSLGLSYMHYAWTAHGGYLRYGRYYSSTKTYDPLTESDKPIPVSGAIISYSQDWLLLPIGISFDILPGSLFSGLIWFNMGPMLKFVGRDNHYLLVNTGNWNQFIDEITGGYSLEPGVEFRFSPSRRLALRLRFSWRSITANSHGASYGAITGINYPGSFFSFGNLAGGLFQALDSGIGVEIRL
jgi:outer membrane protease